ncbi:SDR family NAD(P)-dependent oxidoreductase [Parasedimentitalea psychrophila]|uniref:SDR family oxidoreductase n=1 Tax=Parasedimentitalea psychrophila TaxID=2997337 RepID=A0A9Y2L444_9RHOB|nr:SDR family oxidoreductase [Parasedimentitalea psychrophila]WIY27052.1 SDR family oxidoreductase [Parasedimentitalea psychrophila]
MKKNIFIVGGTSGVGKELATHYVSEGHNVCVTGRKDPGLAGATYAELAITDDSATLSGDIDRVLGKFEQIHTLIYAAGFLQRGHIDQLSDHSLRTMTNVGLLAPMMLIQRLKQYAPTPLKVMLITSSSQYTPREHEPAYSATKSGLGMLGASLARDPEIGKVLVAAPSGIRTPFWEDTGEDTQTMLDPKWVAQQIVDLSSGAFKYKYAKLLRDPVRTEIVECLDSDLCRI